MGFFWNKAKAAAASVPILRRLSFFASASENAPRVDARARAGELMAKALAVAPVSNLAAGMDGSDGVNSIKAAYRHGGDGPMSDVLLGWYFNQGFIGHQIAAFVSQHWLVYKACDMPARDAIRQGYEIVSDDGGELDAAVLQAMKKADERFRLNHHMRDFVCMGRVFGIRIAIFRVDSTDPDYYANPFNPDGVTPGSYRGIVMVDPYWITPLMDVAAASDPASPNFYEPTWWQINGVKYHRSHLVIFRNGSLPDILKPVYLYGGIPLPQQIMERVYGAERTANEGPLLAMTKRTTIFGTDMAQVIANEEEFLEKLAKWVRYRDNHAVKMIDKEIDSVEQIDTSLTDLDATIMTQYQLVAAIANVPATKLLGTTPKGFNSTGEYEEASYHEHLESVQAHDLTPLVERHHLLVMRSIVAPLLTGGEPIATSVVWEKLDSPTAKEDAETRKIEAETAKTYVDIGAIDGVDVRNRIASDRRSGYHGIEPGVREEPDAPEDPLIAGDAMGLDCMNPIGGAKLMTNQTFIDPEIVRAKIAEADFRVQVSPAFPDSTGALFRIIIDGHHSLAAARTAGVPPVFVEGDYGSSDYVVVESEVG